MRALAATKCCSACEDVRAAGQQVRRQPGRNAGNGQLVDGLAARDGTRVAAEQHAEQVLLAGDGGFVLGNRLAGDFVLRFDLADLHLRHGAVLVTQLENAQRLGVGLFGGAGDFQLPVETAQGDIAVGGVGGQAEQHRPAGFLAGQQVGAGRLVGAADASPQVDLPGGVDRPLVIVVGAVVSAGPGRLRCHPGARRWRRHRSAGRTRRGWSAAGRDTGRRGRRPPAGRDCSSRRCRSACRGPGPRTAATRRYRPGRRRPGSPPARSAGWQPSVCT